MRELEQPQCLAGIRLHSVLLVSFQVIGQCNSLGRVQKEGPIEAKFNGRSYFLNFHHSSVL